MCIINNMEYGIWNMKKPHATCSNYYDNKMIEYFSHESFFIIILPILLLILINY